MTYSKFNIRRILVIILSMAGTRTNQEWLHDLTAGGLIQEAAIADLRQILLRAA